MSGRKGGQTVPQPPKQDSWALIPVSCPMPMERLLATGSKGGLGEPMFGTTGNYGTVSTSSAFSIASAAVIQCVDPSSCLHIILMLLLT